MKRYKQFDSLVVADFEVDQWQHPLHNHNHFEIIFIGRGKGIHKLNGVEHLYGQGDLFLLGPEDEHEFQVKERSRFIYFKFTKLYIAGNTELPLPNQWNRDVDQLLASPERKKGNLLHSEEDRALAGELMEMIVAEYQGGKVLGQKIIYQLFSIIMLLLKRNRKAFEHTAALPEQAGIAEEIMEYIALNIYDPDKLKLKSLAEHFHYSPNYIGMLFKEKVGSTLRDYVGRYRFKLIEQRLQQGKLGMKQIAAEFGFVDESHLYKFIKSRKEPSWNTRV